MKAVLLLCLLLTGCVSYRHEGQRPDGTKDSTHFMAFLFIGTAGKIRSEIRESTNYSRIVSVGNIQGKGDVEMIEAIVAGAVAGAKKGSGVP